MEKTNSLGKVFCYQKIWIVAWAGDAWFKVSYNSFAKVTRQKGPPAESSSLPKAAYKSSLVRTSLHFYGIMHQGPSSVLPSLSGRDRVLSVSAVCETGQLHVPFLASALHHKCRWVPLLAAQLVLFKGCDQDSLLSTSVYKLGKQRDAWCSWIT